MTQARGYVPGYPGAMSTRPLRFDYDGLEHAEEALAKAAIGGEPSYVRMTRIDSATSSPQIGRREWNAIDMANYLREDDGDESDDTMSSLYDEPIDVDTAATPDAGNAAAAAASKDEQHRIMAAAMIRWAKDLARGQMGPDSDEVLFKLELRSPKGAAVLAAPRIRCRLVKGVTEGPDGTPNIDPTIPVQPAGAPTVLAATGRVVDPDQRAWNALNVAFDGMVNNWQRAMGLNQAAYTHLTRLNLAVLQDTREATAMTNRELLNSLRRLTKENADKDQLIRRLADELIGFRIDLAGLGLDTAGQRDHSEQNAAMVNNAVQQIGKLGELYIAGRHDIEPELVAILMMVRSDAKLLECLKNPKVLKALKNPEFRDGIIDTLNTVAASIPDDDPTSPHTEPTA